MTDQRDKATATPAETAAESAVAVKPSISRRDVLRGASAAVPTILTLNSGAALAASSYEVRRPNTSQPVADRYVCLDTQGSPGPTYDYSGGAEAKAIHKNRLFVRASVISGIDKSDTNKINNAIRKAIQRGQVYRGDQLCADGESYIPVTANGPMMTSLGAPDLQTVSVPRGWTLSAGAYGSMDASGLLDTRLL